MGALDGFVPFLVCGARGRLPLRSEGLTPYLDADLAALALQRGALRLADLRRAAEGVAATGGGRGALARALVHLRLLDPGQLELLLRDLALAVRACPGCGQTHAVLPWPGAARPVRCPACGREEWLQPDPGAPPPPPPGWHLPASDVPGPPTRRLPHESGAASASGRLAPPSSHPGRVAATARAPGGPATRPPEPGGTWYDPQAPRSSGRVRGPGSDAVAATRHDASSHGGPRSSQRLGQREREALAPGALIGPYVIEAEISRGAMGIVLRAHHHEVRERVVAVKVMKTDLESDEESMERFRREGVALARLEHQNVVRVHDADFTSEGHAYLAMDYVEGETLEQLLRKEGPLPLERAARLMEGVARGVAHLHERSIVHRDLKLGNVLVDGDGRPRIADFGLAHLQDRRTRLTMAGDLLGTPLYMAPEAISPDGQDLDGRADVYALGVMFWRLLTNTYPFHAELPALLFEQVLKAPLKFPAQPALDGDTRAVLGRALARERSRRYPSADELADDLLALAGGGAVRARERRRAEVALAWARRRWQLLGLGLLAAVLLAGTLLWLRGTGQRGVSESLATLTARLEGEAARLRDGRDLPPGDLDRVQGELDRAVRRLAEAGGDPAAQARAEATARRLADELVHARARLALRTAHEAGDTPAALASALPALDACARLSGPDDGPPLARLQLERARLLLGLGRPAEALDALRGAEEGPTADLLAAWSRLELSRPDACDPLVSAPAALAAMLVVQAELAPSAPAAAALVQRARALLEPLPSGPAVELCRREADLVEAGSQPTPLRALLEPLRALTGEATPPPVRGRAALLWALALLRLGQPATAAEAARQALAALPADPYPGLAFPLGPGEPPRLWQPRLAGALLEAMARGELPDQPAALAAARAAEALGGASDEARRAARALLARAQPIPPGGAAEPPAAPDDAAARRSLVRGALLLARDERPEAARRAFLLASAAARERELQARAWIGAGRAALRLALADPPRKQAWLEEARAHLARVEGAGAGGWRAADLRGELCLLEDDPRGAGLAWRQAMEALAHGPERVLQRAAHAMALRARAVKALRRVAPPQALAIQSLAVDLADEAHLELPLRERLLTETSALAADVSGPEVASLWNDRIRNQLQPEFDRYNQLAARISEEKRRVVAGNTDPGLPEAQQAYLRHFYADPLVYVYYYGSFQSPGMAGSELRWQAVDALALAFELRPLPVFVNYALQEQRRSHSPDSLADVSRQATRMTLERLLTTEVPRDPALTPCDERLRLALIGGSALEVFDEGQEAVVERVLPAAWDYALERPGELPASIALGRLLMEAGDLVEARSVFAGLPALSLPFGPAGPGERAHAYLWDAMAAAALGQTSDAQQALERAASDALAWQSERGTELSRGWLAELGDRMRRAPSLAGIGATTAERLGSQKQR